MGEVPGEEGQPAHDGRARVRANLVRFAGLAHPSPNPNPNPNPDPDRNPNLERKPNPDPTPNLRRGPTPERRGGCGVVGLVRGGLVRDHGRREGQHAEEEVWLGLEFRLGLPLGLGVGLGVGVGVGVGVGLGLGIGKPLSNEIRSEYE